VQTAHEDALRTAAELQVGVRGAQQRDQFIVDDLDHLLARLDRLDDFGADRLLPHRLDEILRDLEIHVRIQQRHAHVAQGVGHVIFADATLAGQVAEDVLQLAAEGIELGGEAKEGG